MWQSYSCTARTKWQRSTVSREPSLLPWTRGALVEARSASVDTDLVLSFNYHSQAKLFARMSSSIKALIAMNALSRTSDSDTSERTTGRSVRAQHEVATYMERQLVDLHEKEMRIARCW